MQNKKSNLKAQLANLKWSTFLKAIKVIYGIEIKLVETQAELIEAGKVRFTAYKHAEIIVPSEIEDNILIDRFDDSSYNIIALKYGQVVGTVRLTTADSKSVFPHEEVFKATIPFDRAKTVEIGKFAVHPSHRKDNRVIAFGLTLFATQLSIKKELRYWLLATNDILKKSFERLGSKIHVLNSDLKSISGVKKVTKNRKFYLKSPYQYYWLKVDEIQPNFGKRKKSSSKQVGSSQLSMLIKHFLFQKDIR